MPRLRAPGSLLMRPAPLLKGCRAAVVGTDQIVMRMRVAGDVVKILFESLPDRLCVLIDYQASAMGQYEGSLVSKQARAADVQDLIGINQNFLTLKRQAADEKHVYPPSNVAARVPKTRHLMDWSFIALKSTPYLD